MVQDYLDEKAHLGGGGDVIPHGLRPATSQWDHHLLLPWTLRGCHYLALELYLMPLKEEETIWG